MLKQVTHRIIFASTLMGVAGLYGLASMEGAISAEWARPSSIPILEVAIEPDGVFPQVIRLDNVGHLKEVLEQHEYRFEDLMQQSEIPRLFFTNFPKDIRQVKCVCTKKALFLQTLLPIILHVNEEILAEREKLLNLFQLVEAGESLGPEDTSWLQELAEKYKLRRADFAELKLRVDVIPPSMALGQAVIESGWGHSYAAREKNSPYGMTVSDEVKFYQSLHESTWSYVRNLNSHRAYREMRMTRAKQRAQGKIPDGHTLMGDLIRYSERGGAYIEEVRLTITHNKLALLDSVIQLQQITAGSEAAA